MPKHRSIMLLLDLNDLKWNSNTFKKIQIVINRNFNRNIEYYKKWSVLSNWDPTQNNGMNPLNSKKPWINSNRTKSHTMYKTCYWRNWLYKVFTWPKKKHFNIRKCSVQEFSLYGGQHVKCMKKDTSVNRESAMNNCNKTDLLMAAGICGWFWRGNTKTGSWCWNPWSAIIFRPCGRTGTCTFW